MHFEDEEVYQMISLIENFNRNQLDQDLFRNSHIVYTNAGEGLLYLTLNETGEIEVDPIDHYGIELCKEYIISFLGRVSKGD